MDELVGIIQGIDSDNTINKKEVEAIRRWVDHNYELKSNPLCTEVFVMLDEILEDGIIDDQERELLLDYANDYLIAHNSKIEVLNVLDGIINGIVCDDIINEKEVHSLHRWLKKNRHLSGEDSFDLIFEILEKVLKDRVVTEEEKEELLHIFSAYVNDKKAAMRMADIKERKPNEKKLAYDSEKLINLSKRIDDLISNTKTIYVVKGVRDYSNLSFKVSKLCDLNINEIVSNNEIDEEVLLRDLLPKITGNTTYVISYEEFNLLPDAIINMMITLKYCIKVIDNNLFHNFYPVKKRINKIIIQKGLDKEGDNLIKKIWDEYFIINGEMFVSYQAIEANHFLNIDYLWLFPEKPFDKEIHIAANNDVYDFSTTEETYLSTVLDILNSDSKEISVIKSKDGLLSYQEKLLRVLTGLGYSVNLVRRSIQKITDEKIGEYEDILKRKNPSFGFKSIDFYAEPGVTLETQSISQGEIVSALVNNAVNAYTDKDYYDIFVTAPTGAGKSILFQIPAIFLAEQYELLTIVVTPLIGLMNDQVNNIGNMTNMAATINSDYTPEEKETIKEEIQSGIKSVLYVSPETLLSNNPISALIGDRKIGLFVVDEAHIVSTWGKSFRPDYWYLGDYISYLRQKGGYRFPLATFSATITYGGSDDMHGDIIDSLKMKTGRFEYIAPMRRDDISFEINVIEKENDYLKEKEVTVKTALSDLVRNNKKTIAYFPYVSHINKYYDLLKTNLGDDVSSYYGGLDKNIKNQNMKSFAECKRGLMLATKAFGMGIDIDDIDVVYHFAPTGNLCDYVQEIGRAARDKNIQGIAKTDYYQEDFRFIKQLFGMSAINNYHLRAILSKLRNVYYEKRSRNFTVSPDDFAYVFSDSRDFGDSENKLKTAVLMIQKDFELNPYINFKPLIFRPRSLFTKGYFMVNDEDAERINNSRYRRYIRKYADKDSMSNESTQLQRFWDSNSGQYKTRTNKLVVTQTRNVYVVNFKKMWEECFDEYTFANFKRLFYEGQLRGIEYSANFAQKYLLTIRASRRNFADVQDRVALIINELVDVFSKPDIGKKHLLLEEIADMLKRLENVEISSDESMLVAETFVNIINEYSTSSQFNNIRPFSYNLETKKYIIRSINALVSRIKKLGFDFKTKLKSALDSSEKTFLIDDKVGDIKKQATKSIEMHIAQFLEAFNLASYQVVTGERPEYFVRINSITQIEKILNDTDYQSKMVSLVRRRHEQSMLMMTEFFTKLQSDIDRWNYIERYFVGMPLLKDENKKEQIVKHKKFGKGIIINIENNKVIIQFENEESPKMFQYPDVFESKILQRIN